MAINVLLPYIQQVVEPVRPILGALCIQRPLLVGEIVVSETGIKIMQMGSVAFAGGVEYG